MSLTDQDRAGMTDEEIAAMAELEEQLAGGSADDPEFNPDEVVKPEDQAAQQQEEEQQQEEQQALTPEEEQAKADQEAADKAAADAAAAEAANAKEPAPTPARAPILVADAPEDAEAKLAEIAEKKAALGDQFDDGDLTSKEYQAKLDELNKEERTLERAIDKADIARDLENQRQTNERMAEINTFLASVDIPHDPKNLRFRVLDAAVRDVASDEANVSLSATEIMQKAFDLCVEEGALQPKKAADTPAKPAPKAPAARTPVNAPPTLAGMPASEVTNTEDNRFAYLNRINDPDKREAAFAKLSAADQEAYLATGG